MRLFPGMRSFAVFLGALALAATPGATPRRVVVIPIEGDIDLGLAPFVERVLLDTTAADVVLLHVNTFGGRIDAAVRIRDALLRTKSKTVAFVDRRAISAGALIALACDTIAMNEGATLGAATPVQFEGGEMKTAPPKVISYMRKEMKATAEAKKRHGEVAEAMVDPDVVIAGLNEKGKLVTLTTEEALRWKIAELKAPGEPALLSQLGLPAAAVMRPQIGWAERVARFLSSPAVSGLLMTLGMLGIMIELYSPGHALAGGVGVLFLLLFFFGHLVIKLAGLEVILLFTIGVGLVIVELFALPGHILPGVLGAMAILSSLVLALIDIRHVPLDVQWHMGALKSALSTVALSFAATLAAGILVVRALPSTRFGRALVLSEASAPAPKTPARADVGQKGHALTPLRPVGKAQIGDVRLEVTTDGDFVSPGESILVIRTEGNRIVVRKG